MIQLRFKLMKNLIQKCYELNSYSCSWNSWTATVEIGQRYGDWLIFLDALTYINHCYETTSKTIRKNLQTNLQNW